MGVIQEARSAAAVGEEEQRRARENAHQQVVDAITSKMGEALESPVFTGDVESALFHHAGEHAVRNETMTEPYISLATRIEQYAAGHPEVEDVPVLFTFRNYDHEGDYAGSETAVAFVPRGTVAFKSEKTSNQTAMYGGKMVQVEGTDHKQWQPDTTTVSTERLSLLAPTVACDGDILGEEDIRDNSLKGSEELVLFQAEHSAISMRNGVEIERFEGEENYRVLVGWEEIEEAVAARIKKQVNRSLGNATDEAAKIPLLFTREALAKHAPQLEGIVSASEVLRCKMLGGVATTAS